MERLNRRCRIEELAFRTTVDMTEPDGTLAQERAMRTLDEAIGLLTGLPAGEGDESGEYPADSVNALGDAPVRELARGRQVFTREALLTPGATPAGGA